MSFIPKAKNITGTDFENEDIFTKSDKPVLFYCSIGYRSSLAARLFQQKFPGRDVYNLDGSIFEYANKDHKLEAKNQDSDLKKVHGYDEKWCKLLKKEYRYLDK